MDDPFRDYDAWKLREPDYYSYEEPPDRCADCGAEGECSPGCPTRIAASRVRRLRMANRDLWRRMTFPIRWKIYRLLSRLWPRKACTVLHDDEIPF